jgi:hypothetical protein
VQRCQLSPRNHYLKSWMVLKKTPSQAEMMFLLQKAIARFRLFIWKSK